MGSMQLMGTGKWSGLLLLWLVMTASIADESMEGRERDFLRLSKRDLLRLSKKSGLAPDYSDNFDYEDQNMSEIKRDVPRLTKKDLLRLSKKSLLPNVSPLHMSQRSLRLSKRQIGQLLQIKRGSLTRDLRLSR